MKLYFDTSDNKLTIVRLGHKEIVSSTTTSRSQQLLPLIVKILKQTKFSARDITQVEFNPGPGSYTGLKVGAAIANALGLALNVPVNGHDVARDGPAQPKYEKCI